jgi:hypothetical protein
MSFLSGDKETRKEVLESREDINFSIVTSKCYWDFEEEEWVFFAPELKDKGVKDYDC